jgi:hypothetical protein
LSCTEIFSKPATINPHKYFSSDAEIEKLQMQLDMKDKELTLLQREIAYLKELLKLHKQQKSN